MPPASTILTVDWRQTQTSTQILRSISNLILDLDSNSVIEVVLSTGRKYEFLEADDIDNTWGHPMVLRRQKSVKRHLLDLPSASDYVIRFIRVANFISRKVDAKLASYQRATTYDMSTDYLSPAQIRQCIGDLALTMNVHIFNLGILPDAESKGQVRLPTGCSMDLYQVADRNIFQYADVPFVRRLNEGCDQIHWNSDTVHTMEPLIHSMNIVLQPDSSIRAVVVTEHRSLKELIPRYAGNPAYSQQEFSGIFQIFTGGYPDVSTREFLHLLCNHSSLKNVPFMYLSDCDVDGLNIYCTLKYGSLSSAYFSPSTICPKLKWVGLRAAELYEYALGTVANLQRIYERDHGGFRNAMERRTWIVKKRKELTQQVKDMMNSKEGFLTRSDRSRGKGLQTHGILDRPEEALAKQELERLMGDRNADDMRGRKISLHSLNVFGQPGAGVAFYLRDLILAERKETIASPLMFPALSQGRRHWNAIDSQGVKDVPTASSPDILTALAEANTIQ